MQFNSLKHGAAIGTPASECCTQAPPSTVMSLAEKLSWLAAVTGRLESKMDFIDGPQPQPAAGSQANTSSGGFVRDLDVQLGYLTDRIDSQVRRLERIVG